MLRRACALAQTRQGLQFMHTLSVVVYEGQTKTRNRAPSHSCACITVTRLSVKAKASLRIGTDSPGPSLYAYTKCESVCKSDQNNKLSLSHSCACMILRRLSAKAQAGLRIGTDSPGPSLYAYIKCESVCKSDQNNKLSLSHSCACMIVTRLSVKPQASLHIGTESPGPSLYAYTRCESVCKSDQNEKFSLSHSCARMIVTRLSVKAQASLRIGTESPGPSLYAYTSCESVCKSDQNKKFSLSQSCACIAVTRLSVKAKASLRIGKDSPGPSLYAYTKSESVCKSDQNEKFSLSHSCACMIVTRLSVKGQASLRIGTDSSEPTVYAYTRCENVCKSDQNNKLSLSHSCACMIVTRLSVKPQASLRIGSLSRAYTLSIRQAWKYM